jgi:hypothetical protein
MTNKILIALLAIAIVLGIVAYFTVFTPGTYEFASNAPAAASGTLSFNALANETGTPAAASGTGSAFMGNSAASGTFASTYSYPYVMNWNEGQNDFSVTGAAFDGANLALTLKIQVGNVGGCLPLDLRLVTDETGDVEAPQPAQFIFPDTSSCNGTPNATYADQTLVFPMSPLTPTPWLFTTGGTSNQFFQVSTTTTGIQIQLPSTSG